MPNFIPTIPPVTSCANAADTSLSVDRASSSISINYTDGDPVIDSAAHWSSDESAADGTATGNSIFIPVFTDFT